ncbi:peptidyl-prolyl cis-trans isomerase-like 4 [Branchiostoma floridae]|uniref:Peptidyl-prolyl cis-trans isomerase n=1 Tax=Branchiostoma floridae TaxID=7739 RepID=A0A9J7MZ11_BRAFL|nr:peptidyl-prolyl cis-trans isomerase-like 4 [Branchiostoma floridae]
MAVILETTLGDITVDLLTEERPRTCLNFLKLCKMKYYNFCLFHSVQRNFMVQTGDPTGTGRGGESIFSKLYGDQARFFEMETNPRLKHRKVGTVSMVNNGGNMHGSQFLITTREDVDYLDGQHTVFGEVSEGDDVLAKINEAICDNEHRPYQDIRINHTVVLDDPFDDPAGLADHIPDRSPEPTKEQLESGRIGADEAIDDTEGRSQEEVEEMLQEKEAQARTQILEMVGDLPEADVAPPDNVLFVCKLNPVTQDDDLEVIFSRFGEIKCCEVIRDQKTGDSLCYAFVEFEKPEACEEAYFKMDNVLIDDRRIHVDFSQSVSKVWKGGPNAPKGGQKSKFELKDKTKGVGKQYDLILGDDDDDEAGPSRTQDRGRGPDPSHDRRSKDTENRSRHDKHKKTHRRDSSSSEDDRRHRKKHHKKERDPHTDRRGRDGSSSEDDRRHKKHRRHDRDSDDGGHKKRDRHERDYDKPKHREHHRSRSREKEHRHSRHDKHRHKH